MKRFAFILLGRVRRWPLVVRLLVIVSCQLSIVNCSWAQDTFTQRLLQPVTGQGSVVLRQDAEIASLVNGTTSLKRTGTKPIVRTLSGRIAISNDTLVNNATDDKLEVDTLPLTPSHKVRMSGYRVQVYAGGNSRDAKRRAYQMEGQVRQMFPEQPVYTRFVSPRWICHVGDFKTREEALELLSDMRKTGRFPEAITVRCKINAYVYE